MSRHRVERVELVACHHRHELLDSFVLFHLSGVDVPLRVHGDRVDPVKLAGVRTITAESAERLAAIAVENPHFVIRSVSDVEVLLLRITREGKLVGGSARRELLVIETAANFAARGSVGRHVELPEELPLLCEHLDPVLAALADIHQPVLRKLDEVQVGDEILFFWRRTASPLVSGNRVVG